MSNASGDRDQVDGTTGAVGDGEQDDLHPEGLDPERPAMGVDDVIEVFDREPPERPVTDSDVQAGFG